MPRGRSGQRCPILVSASNAFVRFHLLMTSLITELLQDSLRLSWCRSLRQLVLDIVDLDDPLANGKHNWLSDLIVDISSTPVKEVTISVKVDTVNALRKLASTRLGRLLAAQELNGRPRVTVEVHGQVIHHPMWCNVLHDVLRDVSRRVVLAYQFA
jgi:hypothetical protein